MFGFDRQNENDLNEHRFRQLKQISIYMMISSCRVARIPSETGSTVEHIFTCLCQSVCDMCVCVCVPSVWFTQNV